MSLRIRKLDLHTHSPASHDFGDKTITAEQIVQHAVSCGLDGIAITDHNTVDFIDKIQDAAKGTALAVFPGVEISCGGTQEGSVHIIALFDPKKTKQDLERVLGRLEVRGSGEAALTSKSVNDVINMVAEEEGIPVLAHANSTHGALTDIRGNPRTEVVKNRNLRAVEATAADFGKPSGKRLIDILDGRDAVYKRKLAVYQASDNPGANGHGLKGIGTSFTYFKMGEMTLESLRQCFEDPDSRIVQRNETEKLADSHPRILELRIEGGFLDGQKIELHGGMNSIIGGTGTGKSLLIEFLRFALNKAPQAMALFADHKEKLQKQLRIHGRVAVRMRDASGEEYEISRELSSNRDPYESTLTCANKTTGTPFNGDINTIFPTLIYSQNEILEITRDPRAQLALLDNFRDFSRYRTKTAEITAQLKALDLELVKNRTVSVALPTLKKNLSTIQEQLKKAERGLKGKIDSQVLAKYNALKKEKEALTEEVAGYDELEGELATVQRNLQEVFDQRAADPDSASQLAGDIFKDVNKQWTNIIAAVASGYQTVTKAKTKALEKVRVWEKDIKFEQAEAAYKAQVKKKALLQEKEAARRDLEDQQSKLELKLKKSQRSSQALLEVRGKRTALLSELASLATAYSDERTEQANLITSRSGGKLRITVMAQTDTTKYSQGLLKLKIGSRAEKTEIEDLVGKIPPDKLVELVLDGDFKTLSREGGVSEQMARNIVAELTKEENLGSALALQYLGHAEDQVEIEYCKKDGNYYPLSALSMGQKADALVMIALGDGTAPVIIDQPEDALDIPSIWTDVCSRIRPVKHGRQFVFTTHNSSISVASDSDQFTILEADGTRGRVSKSGSIDQKPVREDIVGHLEGGYSSYDLKRRKYGL